MLDLRGYVDESGHRCFAAWFEGLDGQAAARVTLALTRMEQGNLSNARRAGFASARMASV